MLIEAVVRRGSVNKGVLRNFAKFTEKHICQRLLFNKVAGHRSLNFSFQKLKISFSVILLQRKPPHAL